MVKIPSRIAPNGVGTRASHFKKKWFYDPLDGYRDFTEFFVLNLTKLLGYDKVFQIFFLKILNRTDKLIDNLMGGVLSILTRTSKLFFFWEVGI